MAQNETSVSGDVVFQDGDDLSETNLTRTAAKSNLTGYVERGLGLNVDGAAGTVDIGSGHAIVQDGINAYDLFPNQQTGIALPGSGTNYIYVAIQPGSDDDVYYHIDEDQTPPTDPSILIGTADASAGTSAVLNRRPDQEIGDADIDQLVAALDANGQDINNVGSLSTDSLSLGQLASETRLFGSGEKLLFGFDGAIKLSDTPIFYAIYPSNNPGNDHGYEITKAFIDSASGSIQIRAQETESAGGGDATVVVWSLPQP